MTLSIVIPTEGRNGPSGGIWGVGAESRIPASVTETETGTAEIA